MSSKKTKIKNIKCKKKIRCGKLKHIGYKKKINTKFFKNSRLKEKNIDSTLLRYWELDDKNCRYDPKEKGVFDLIDFAKMRERYFDCLRTVVSENCTFCETKPSVVELENLSLELEKEALLASLQANTYIKAISKIINEIKKCTKEKIICKEVQNLLPKEKNESFKQNSLDINSHSEISLISNSSTQHFLDQTQEPVESSLNESIVVDDCCSNKGEFSSKCSTTYLPQSAGVSVVSSNQENNWCDDDKAERALISSLPDMNSVVQCQSSNNVPVKNLDVSNETTNCKNLISSFSANELEQVNPLLHSLSQLQKSVEHTLTASEKIFKQKAEEKERAYIAQILEGESSLNEHSDSLSENENDTKKNSFKDSFISRVEKMREIFGMEDSYNDEKKKSIVKQNGKECQTNYKSRRPTIWKHERVIQQYKYAMLSSEMSFMRQILNKKLFLQLFGDDSDEEYEAHYRSEEKYRASCTERISSWVVKYLMPYYNDQRIIGRNVFKNLGHYISDTIVDEIQYPDEWAVKYFVSKFFPTQKRYISEADILTFQLD